MASIDGLAQDHGLHCVLQRTPGRRIVQNAVNEVLGFVEAGVVYGQRVFARLTIPIEGDLRRPGQIELDRQVFGMGFRGLDAVADAVVAHHDATTAVSKVDDGVITGGAVPFSTPGLGKDLR